jgi:Outer membrane protein beta-barrel domain
MQNIVKITFVLLTWHTALSAQALEGRFTAGGGIGFARFAYENKIQEFDADYSLAGVIGAQALMQIKQSRFHLGASLTQMESKLVFAFNPPQDDTRRWNGTYQNSQIGVQGLSEMRFFKDDMGYFQLGAGVIFDRGSIVTRGSFNYLSGTQLQSADISGSSWSDPVNFIFSYGFGVRAKLTEQTRITAGFQHLIPTTLTVDENNVYVRFRYFVMQVGLAHQL